MIIRQDRIAAAGCVLPLTENTAISSDLGTRHRAGIGMSEASDAVVVIVSEETGIISVAVGGMLKRSLSAETLQKLLGAELCPQQDDSLDSGILGQIQRWLDRREEQQRDGSEKKRRGERKESDHEK